MSNYCQVTGKRRTVGHTISHSNRKTKRPFLPNLQKHTYWVDSLKRKVTLTVSANGMRIIDKLGIDTVVARLQAEGEIK